MKRIGIITSGGDVPGLNACIRAATRTAIALGAEVIGIENGYAGLIKGQFQSLTLRSVSGILTKGGTFLQTARSKEFETEAGVCKAAQQVRDGGIDGLIIIGGNGSLMGANALYQLGVPLVGVPKTIDNDQYGTDIAIGVDTALNTISDAVSKIKDTASSHHRAFLVETMGRDCGYLALASGIISGAEMVLVPELPATPDEVAEVILRSYQIGKAHCIIMVAEGWKPGTQALKSYLNTHRDDDTFDVREVVLGHIQRGGTPSAFDRMLATRLGAAAAEKLLDGSGVGQMVGLQGGSIGTISLHDATHNCKGIDERLLKLADILAK